MFDMGLGAEEENTKLPSSLMKKTLASTRRQMEEDQQPQWGHHQLPYSLSPPQKEQKNNADSNLEDFYAFIYIYERLN